MNHGQSRPPTRLWSGEPLAVDGIPALTLAPLIATDDAAACVAEGLRLELWHDLAHALRRPAGEPLAGRPCDDGYELAGSIRPQASDWSVTFVLRQRASGGLVWSDRIAFPAAAHAAWSSRHTQRIARSVTLATRASEAKRYPHAGETAALRAWSALWTQPQTARSNASALAALNELGELGRERHRSATALASHAYATWRAAQYGWNGVSRGAGLKRAQDLAERALDVDPAYADAQFVLAMIHMTNREEALTEAGLLAAVQADPGHAPALGNLGLLRLWQGNYAQTLEQCDHALAISPHEPLRCIWYGSRSLALLLQGELAAARKDAALAVTANPRHHYGWLAFVASAAVEKRREDAMRAMTRLRALTRSAGSDPLGAAQFIGARLSFWQKVAPLMEAVCSLTSPRVVDAGMPRPCIHVRTLGAFCIERDGRPLALGRKLPRRPLEVLKALIAFGGERVQIATLAAALFPDETRTAPRRRFDTALYRLRRVLGDEAIVSEQGLLSLNPRVVAVDALAFAETADHTAYRGTFLPEDQAAAWSVQMREALRKRYQDRLAGIVEPAIDEGRYADALRTCEEGIALEPACERLYQLGIRACTRAGWRADGSRLYQRCRGYLRDELGLSPSSAISDELRALLGS